MQTALRHNLFPLIFLSPFFCQSCFLMAHAFLAVRLDNRGRTVDSFQEFPIFLGPRFSRENAVRTLARTSDSPRLSTPKSRTDSERGKEQRVGSREQLPENPLTPCPSPGTGEGSDAPRSPAPFRTGIGAGSKLPFWQAASQSSGVCRLFWQPLFAGRRAAAGHSMILHALAALVMANYGLHKKCDRDWHAICNKRGSFPAGGIRERQQADRQATPGDADRETAGSSDTPRLMFIK